MGTLKKYWWIFAIVALVGAWAFWRLKKKRATRAARAAAIGKTSIGAGTPMSPDDPQASAGQSSATSKVLNFVKQAAEDIVDSDDNGDDPGITSVTGDAPAGSP